MVADKIMHEQAVKWQQSQNQVGSAVADEYVIMGLRNSKYYGLKTTGSYIWELLAAPISQDDIVTALLDTYDVSPEQCRQDVAAFLKHLADEALITKV